LARFLALDWDHRHLHVVLASVRHGTVQLYKAIALTEGQSPNPAEAEALGRLLADRLKKAGLPAVPVLACVGRDRVILKDIRHPPVPPSEEPALIRFQVAKELTDAPAEVVIDYAPGNGVEATGNRRALGVVLRQELLNTYQTLCRAAGLRLAGLCPRPFGALACLKHLLASGELTPPDPPDAAVGVLVVGQPWAEFSVVRGDQLLFARSLLATPTLARELKRNLTVYAGQSPQLPIRALYVTGRLGAGAVASRDIDGVPVHAFDPFAGVPQPEVAVENRGAFAGAIGLLHAQAERRALPINFAKPKQPKPAGDSNRRRLILIGALAATLVVGAAAFGYAELDSRDRQLAALFDENAELERQLDKFSEDGKRIKALDQWSQGEIVWLDEIYDLTDRVPDINDLRLVQLSGDPMTQVGKSSSVARLLLKGVMTAGNPAVNKLESRLVNDGHYRVIPKKIIRNPGTDRRRFPQQFEMSAEIEKLPPERYVRRLPDASAPSETARDGAAAGGSMPDFGFGGFGGDQP
jgi:hypothetical protein